MLLQLFEKNFFYLSFHSFCLSLYPVASIFAISRKCIMRHFDDQCCVHGHASILGMHNSSQPISLASIFFSYISLTFLPPFVFTLSPLFLSLFARNDRTIFFSPPRFRRGDTRVVNQRIDRVTVKIRVEKFPSRFSLLFVDIVHRRIFANVIRYFA